MAEMMNKWFIPSVKLVRMISARCGCWLAGTADLAEGAVDTGGHPGLGRVDDSDGGGGQWRVDQAAADAGDDHAGDEVGPGAVGVQAGHKEQSEGHQSEAGPDEVAGRDPLAEDAGCGCSDQGGAGQDEQANARLQGRIPEQILQV